MCLRETEKCEEISFNWLDLITNPGRKAMIIGTTLATIAKLNGSTTMLSYGAKIFKAVGSVVSPNLSVVVVGVVQLFGTFIATILVDRAGRRVRREIIFSLILLFVILSFSFPFFLSVPLHCIDNWNGIWFSSSGCVYDDEILELQRGSIQLDSDCELFLHCIHGKLGATESAIRCHRRNYARKIKRFRHNNLSNT